QGRGWITLPGQQILLSVVVDSPFAPHWLVMAASVSALDALASVGVTDDRMGIKWPNDILIEDRKVAGILIETTGNSSKLTGVVGIGMNVNGSLALWPEIAARATTLEDAAHHPFEREAIIIAYMQSLGAIHTQLVADAGGMAKEHLWARWRKRLVTLGRATTVHQGDHLLTGITEDVASDGALVLRSDDGSRTLITWGDVESAGG
ncbi:MAG TPA: biotin--[acetyl-CoA-carboxylase] ligase, partial [Ktedonobacterales bacterium]|nr:biotin--[acetyl-CoA-carboxylase] ligase [Ktedonobacterales bacterium]